MKIKCRKSAFFGTPGICQVTDNQFVSSKVKKSWTFLNRKIHVRQKGAVNMDFIQENHGEASGEEKMSVNRFKTIRECSPW